MAMIQLHRKMKKKGFSVCKNLLYHQRSIKGIFIWSYAELLMSVCLHSASNNRHCQYLSRKPPDKMINHTFLQIHAHEYNAQTHIVFFLSTHMHMKYTSRRFPSKLSLAKTLALETTSTILYPPTSKLPFMSLSGAKMASINQGARCNLQCPECKRRGCKA